MLLPVYLAAIGLGPLETILGLLLSDGGLAGAARRAREHDGVHAFAIQHRPDVRCRGAEHGARLWGCCWCAALSQIDVPHPRGLAAVASPALAGALSAAGLQAWPLGICGLLKTIYDIALLWAFRRVKPPEER